MRDGENNARSLHWKRLVVCEPGAQFASKTGGDNCAGGTRNGGAGSECQDVRSRHVLPPKNRYERRLPLSPDSYPVSRGAVLTMLCMVHVT
jgi:hypothetical protein